MNSRAQPMCDSEKAELSEAEVLCLRTDQAVIYRYL